MSLVVGRFPFRGDGIVSALNKSLARVEDRIIEGELGETLNAGEATLMDRAVELGYHHSLGAEVVCLLEDEYYDVSVADAYLVGDNAYARVDGTWHNLGALSCASSLVA